MDNEKILKKIQNSAKNKEIPKNRKPENIRKKLEEEKDAVEKERRPLFYRWGAAAAILVFVIATAAFSFGAGRREIPMATPDPETIEKESPGEEGGAWASKKRKGDTQDTGIRHVSSYQELYDLVKAYEEENKTFYAEPDILYEGPVAEDSIEAGAAGWATNADGGSKDTSAMGEDYGGAEQDYSRTNIQEQGVWEGDIVKTDGIYLYALGNDGFLRIIHGKSLELESSFSVEDFAQSQVREMYLEGDTIQVIAEGFGYASREEEIAMSDGSRVRTWINIPVQRTMAVFVDVKDKKNPRVKGSYVQDGRYLTSRRNNGYLYLFTSYVPNPRAGCEAKDTYVPCVGDGILPCEDIYLLGEGDKLCQGLSYLVAGAVKDGSEEASDRMAIVGGGEEFYVSRKNVYAAAALWDMEKSQTALIRFGCQEGSFLPGAARRLDGLINNNFSMDEYKDHLRIVVTGQAYDREQGFFQQCSHLYVLDQDLEMVGSIRDLAPGEMVKSARFLGDTGYFVTYRNMDPLFSVDLSDPKNPQILGELKITGFSQYLHFYGEDQLLGIGWETDPDTGEGLGLKCSVFDIKDPWKVKERDRLVFQKVHSCPGLSNYKELLVDPKKNLVGFSYQILEEKTWEELWYYVVFSYDQEQGFFDLAYLKITKELAESYGDYASLRGAYMGEDFYLVSAKGVEKYDMTKGFAMTDRLVFAQAE